MYKISASLVKQNKEFRYCKYEKKKMMPVFVLQRTKKYIHMTRIFTHMLHWSETVSNIHMLWVNVSFMPLVGPNYPICFSILRVDVLGYFQNFIIIYSKDLQICLYFCSMILLA